jgi:hypothetical protein
MLGQVVAGVGYIPSRASLDVLILDPVPLEMQGLTAYGARRLVRPPVSAGTDSGTDLATGGSKTGKEKWLERA